MVGIIYHLWSDAANVEKGAKATSFSFLISLLREMLTASHKLRLWGISQRIKENYYVFKRGRTHTHRHRAELTSDKKPSRYASRKNVNWICARSQTEQGRRSLSQVCDVLLPRECERDKLLLLLKIGVNSPILRPLKQTITNIIKILQWSLTSQSVYSQNVLDGSPIWKNNIKKIALY